jgi:hypothetical protein
VSSFNLRAVTPTSPLACDGCHGMSFDECGTYPLLTTGQFNMCNCTGRRGRAEAADRAATTPPQCRPSDGGREGDRAQKEDRAGPGGVRRDRRRTLCEV